MMMAILQGELGPRAKVRRPPSVAPVNDDVARRIDEVIADAKRMICNEPATGTPCPSSPSNGPIRSSLPVTNPVAGDRVTDDPVVPPPWIPEQQPASRWVVTDGYEPSPSARPMRAPLVAAYGLR
jgi:hypothetical protein